MSKKRKPVTHAMRKPGAENNGYINVMQSGTVEIFYSGKDGCGLYGSLPSRREALLLAKRIVEACGEK